MSKEEEIVFIKDTEKVFVPIKQSGIPQKFFEETSNIEALVDLTPVSFGTEDIKNKPILYLDVDEVISFYNSEFDRLIEEDHVPEIVTDKLLSNFFLFRRVKKDVLHKETFGQEVWKFYFSRMFI